MTSNFKETLFTNWHLRRWLALGIGAFFGIQALIYRDGLSALFAAFFLYQAVTNTGCMAGGGCAVPQDHSTMSAGSTNEKKYEDVSYTEIKE